MTDSDLNALDRVYCYYR